MAVRTLFPVWFDGSLYGRFARFGKVDDFHRDFPVGGVPVAHRVAVDGVPETSDPGSYFRILPDYLGNHQHYGVYRDTGFAAENFACKA